MAVRASEQAVPKHGLAGVAGAATAKTAQQADEEARRYQRLFNNPRRVQYTGMSFPEFATGGLRALGCR